MSEFLCIDCARVTGVAPPLPVSGTVPTSYELRKILQHTVSGVTSKFNSLFDNPSRIDDYMVDAYNSGYVEIDASGRKSWNILADHGTGVTFMSGQYMGSCNAVKIVCCEYSGAMHSYPFTATSGTKACKRCGRPLP